MVATSLPKPRVATIALRNAALMSSTGVNDQLMPMARASSAMMRADLARHRDIVDGGERQRVRRLGAAGKAHAAALEIGRDQERHRRRGVEAAKDCRLRRRVGAGHAGNAAGAEGDAARDLLGIGPHHAQIEQLADLFVGGEARQRLPHPGDRRPIELERLCRSVARHACFSPVSEELRRGFGVRPERPGHPAPQGSRPAPGPSPHGSSSRKRGSPFRAAPHPGKQIPACAGMTVGGQC